MAVIDLWITVSQFSKEIRKNVLRERERSGCWVELDRRKYKKIGKEKDRAFQSDSGHYHAGLMPNPKVSCACPRVVGKGESGGGGGWDRTKGEGDEGKRGEEDGR